MGKTHENAYGNLQHANIEYDYLNGVPYKDMERTYGMSKSGLYFALRRWGVPAKDRLKIRNKKIVNEVKFSGLRKKEIAEKYGLSPESIRRICKKYGNDIRHATVFIKQD